mmetsp:Transcript_875/g.1078  ORF Transcript_875/g.1078 Transcript_875/m.1078 type:complete len:122 (-) Transcript_875:46-411(-)
MTMNNITFRNVSLHSKALEYYQSTSFKQYCSDQRKLLKIKLNHTKLLYPQYSMNKVYEVPSPLPSISSSSLSGHERNNLTFNKELDDMNLTKTLLDQTCMRYNPNPRPYNHRRATRWVALT